MDNALSITGRQASSETVAAKIIVCLLSPTVSCYKSVPP